MNKRPTVLAFVACLALWLAILPTGARADSATLSVLSPATVTQGSTFAVDVNISSVSDLYDYQFDLTFNPAVLSATGLSEGSFLSAGGTTFFLPGTIDNTGGSITFNADTLLSAVSGVSGSGTLVVFDFTALTPGTSDFLIENVILQDSTGASLGSTSTSGSVTVQGTTAVPEPSSLLLLLAGALSLAAVRWKLESNCLSSLELRSLLCF
jgi:hypothetical protein